MTYGKNFQKKLSMKVFKPSEIIGLWPTRAALAADINSISGGRDLVQGGAIHKWASAESIPAAKHQRIIDAAASRGFTVSAEQIVLAHDPRVRENQVTSEGAEICQ